MYNSNYTVVALKKSLTDFPNFLCRLPECDVGADLDPVIIVGAAAWQHGQPLSVARLLIPRRHRTIRLCLQPHPAAATETGATDRAGLYGVACAVNWIYVQGGHSPGYQGK